PVNRDNLDRMFDRFYRMDASRNSETGGHGIGLSMAKAITEAHGGKISASSEDGTSLLMEVVL
ncbi:MAG: two-component sensor histidine kinase, partial [Parasporobacterium sp.]|nr:two-component sensor histidine kinase [Parasporobacterium sp.]